MRTYFERVKKNFGFGCMRLPKNGGNSRKQCGQRRGCCERLAVTKNR